MTFALMEKLISIGFLFILTAALQNESKNKTLCH